MNSVWTVLLALAAILVLWLGLRIAATLGPHCRCGHHRSTHRGRNTECSATRSAGRNALGAPQRDWCPCRSYRRTSVGYWQRITHGTEDWQETR